MLRLAVWQGIGEWRAEAARVDLGPRGLGATGTQIGADPAPYRLDYELEVGSGWITNRLSVQVTSAVGERRLLLEHDARGSWRSDGEPAPALAGALDCDLGLSPLTNVMPVRRHALHEREGVAEILAAWVSVPDLSLHASGSATSTCARAWCGSPIWACTRGSPPSWNWTPTGWCCSIRTSLAGCEDGGHSSFIARPTISFMISLDPP